MTQTHPIDVSAIKLAASCRPACSTAPLPGELL